MIHYNDDIMRAMASQITSLTIVYSIVYSGADQRKHESSASLVNSPHKGPVTLKMVPFDDVIVYTSTCDELIEKAGTNTVLINRLRLMA